MPENLQNAVSGLTVSGSWLSRGKGTSENPGVLARLESWGPTSLGRGEERAVCGPQAPELDGGRVSGLSL